MADEKDVQSHHVHDDLAAAPKMQILYEDLRVTATTTGKDKETVSKDILKGISGVIQPGRLTAVMGSSGAGKTTFLNVLAGYTSSSLKLTGGISVNSEPITADEMQRISGFVQQEDVILDTMTVREALVFSAMMRLPKEMPAAEKEQRALDVADLLGLTSTLDSLVGSSIIKGISGGEKRRLSIGMELITNPSILFLDEPTSGLDTFKAYKVVKILSLLAKNYGRTVVATIHQPSSEIFHLFDDLVLLAEGQVLYHGPVEGAVDFFAKLGYTCPDNCNPADYIFMEVLNALADKSDMEFDAMASFVDTDTSKKIAEQQRLQKLLDSWPASSEAQALRASMADEKQIVRNGYNAGAVKAQAPALLQFLLLGKRALINGWRNPLVTKGKLGQTIFFGILVGLIYLRIDNDLESVQDRQGSLFFIVVNGIFGSIFPLLTTFGGEKAVFKREYAARVYGLPAYFWSRFLVDTPIRIIAPFVFAVITYWMIGYQAVASKFLIYAAILILMDNVGAAMGLFLGCLFNNLEVALAVVPMLLLPLMVFSGFLSNLDTIPVWLRWIQYISPMRYGYVAVAKNEFTGLTINCKPSDKCAPGFNGDTVLEQLGFTGVSSEIVFNAAILVAIMGVSISLAYTALWFNVRKLVRA